MSGRWPMGYSGFVRLSRSALLAVPWGRGLLCLAGLCWPVPGPLPAVLCRVAAALLEWQPFGHRGITLLALELCL